MRSRSYNAEHRSADRVGECADGIAGHQYGDLHVLRQRRGGQSAESDRGVGQQLRRSVASSERDHADRRTIRPRTATTRSSLNGSSAGAGEIDGAASLNGTSNYIQVPNSSSLNGWSQQTVSMWINAQTDMTDQRASDREGGQQ